MRRIILSTGLALALLASTASTAGAVVISKTYTFTASRFSDFSEHLGLAAPYDLVTGAFTLTFDTALGDQSDQSAGLIVHAFSMPVSDGFPGVDNPIIGWNYRSLSDSLSFGGMYQGVSSITKGAFSNNDFYMSINHISTAPVFAGLSYSSPSPNAFFKAGDYSMQITDTGVPEPAAWALMLTGFGCAGAVLRHRRGARPARAA